MTVEQKADEYKETVHRWRDSKGELVQEEDVTQAFIDGYHEGFKDCAKSRLNVTTISDCPIKDEWHYNDYPEKDVEVICKDYIGTNFIAYYDGEDWVTQDDKIVTCVARWKEIE